MSTTQACAHVCTAPPDQHQQLTKLAERVARLNIDSPTIGAGMLASLVQDARRALGQSTEQSR